MRLVVTLVVLVAGLGIALEQGRTAGSPLYPDLRTAPPAGLYLDTVALGDGRTHHVLRFDNLVENHGGPLEITADLRQSRYVYQNIYDQYSGGTLVQHFRVGSDLIYHPSHSHFHFQDFAAYHLLKKDSRGVYRGTTRRGSKTSFCIVDSARVREDIGPSSPGYEICDDQKQGLSPGWGDIYVGQLPEQWIDVGTTKLADGDYAIQSTADPLNKLSETDDRNNAALTYFTVRNGAILTTDIPPSCTVTPTGGPVGTPILVTCTRFTPGRTLNIYWGSVNTTPRTTATVGVDKTATATFIAPEGTLGNHYVIARPIDGGAQAATLFATTASLSQDIAAGPVGSTVNLQMRGFAVSESIAVRYFKTSSSFSTLATVTASTKGSANLAITIPASTSGAHKIEAVGLTSGVKASASFAVQPSLLLVPSSGLPGGSIGASLRGFSAGESVTLRLDGSTTLRTVTASSTGSRTASTTPFTIPVGTNPGPHQVTATGAMSGASASATLTVTAPSAAEADTPTPTPTPDPTETPVPTETLTPTETATPIPSPTPAISPTAEPSSTAEPVTPEPTATPSPEG